MDQMTTPLDAVLIAAGISMVYNADDWAFGEATPRPIHSRRDDIDSVPPTLN